MLEEAAISSMALRLDGKALAKAVEARLSAVISSFSSQAGRPPGLAVLRVGDDPASAVYVANKRRPAPASVWPVLALTFQQEHRLQRS